MLAYTVKRLFTLIPTLLAASILVFLFVHLIPGDPAAILLGDTATPEEIAQLSAEMGFDRPLWIQYFLWLGNVLQGDLGVPATTVVLGHAQHREDHVAVKRDIRAAGGNQIELCIDLLCEIGAVFLKKTDQEVIRLVRHSTSPSSQNLERQREIHWGHDTACVAACLDARPGTAGGLPSR